MRMKFFTMLLTMALLLAPLQATLAAPAATASSGGDLVKVSQSGDTDVMSILETLFKLVLGQVQGAVEQKTGSPLKLYEELDKELGESAIARTHVKQYVLASRAVTSKHAKDFRGKEIFVYLSRKIPVVGRGFSNMLLSIFVNEYKQDLRQKDAEPVVQKFIKLRGLAIAAGQESFEWQLDHPGGYEGDADRAPEQPSAGAEELQQRADKLFGYVALLVAKSGVQVQQGLDAGNLFSLDASKLDYDKGEAL